MNQKNIYYELQLSHGQLQFLASSNQGTDRMSCLVSLIEMAAHKATPYKKKFFSSVLEVGQVALSEVELAKLWHCNRKTASRMIDKFNEIGLISSAQSNRTSVHTIHCVSRWLVDGIPIRNTAARILLPLTETQLESSEPEVSASTITDQITIDRL